MTDPGLPNVNENWQQGDTLDSGDFNEVSRRVNAAEDELAVAAAVFVQQADPEVANADITGPAIWLQTDGSGNIIDWKVRTS